MRGSFIRSVFWSSCLIAVALYSVPTPKAMAQSKCGGIDGRVTSVEGWVIPKASVRFLKKSTKNSTNVESDANGEYSACLSPGVYDVFAKALGYKPAKRKSIKVDASAKNLIDFVMKHDESGWVDREHP